MSNGKHVATPFDELVRPRARSIGILTALLILLVAFAFSWYFVFAKVSQAQPAADMTGTTSLAQTDPFYVLLLGSDSRKNTALYAGATDEESQAPGNADVVVLVRIDPGAHVVTLLSVPSNTVAPGEVASVGMSLQEDDIEAVVNQVQSIARVPIPYYAMTSFTGFQEIVDIVGGVTVDVSEGIWAIDPATGERVNVAAGTRKLDSAQAMALVRSSDLYQGDFCQQDAQRQANVRNVLRALIFQASNLPEGEIRSCMTVLAAATKTNIEHTLLVSLVLDYAQHRNEYVVYVGTGPTDAPPDANEFAVPANMDAWAQVMGIVNVGNNPSETG